MALGLCPFCPPAVVEQVQVAARDVGAVIEVSGRPRIVARALVAGVAQIEVQPPVPGPRAVQTVGPAVNAFGTP